MRKWLPNPLTQWPKIQISFGSLAAYRTNKVPATMVGEVLTMPLRDHFPPPLENRRSWDELHGAWPAMIVMALNEKLPARYVAGPRIHLGAYSEINEASIEEEEPNGLASVKPVANLPEQDQYEVRVYD